MFDVQSHLDFILESRMSSKTPGRMLWRLTGERPLPMHLEAWNLAHSFLNAGICHYWHPKLSRPHSESIMSFKAPCLMLCRLIGESPLPVNQTAWNFEESFFNAYIHVHVHVLIYIYMYISVYVVLEECRMSSKTPWKTQRQFIPLNEYIWTTYNILLQVVPLVANYGTLSIAQSFKVGFLGCTRESLAFTLFNTCLTQFNPV